ncbi:MFS transporter [Orenia metallireducens]|nr:MFS transporter [Orenia metallireducens]
MLGSLLVGFLPAIFIKILVIGEKTQLISYKYVLLTLGGISFLSTIPISHIKEEKPIKTDTKEAKFDIVTGIKKEQIGKLSLCQFLLRAGGDLIVPFFSIFLVNNLGASTGQAGTIMFLYQIIRVLVLLFTPLLIRKVGKVRSVGITQITSLPSLLAIVSIPNFAIAGISFPITFDFAMEITTNSQHTITSSLMRTSNSIAKSSSSVLAGWLVTNYDYNLTYFLTFFIYLIGIILLVKSFLKIENKELKYSI